MSTISYQSPRGTKDILPKEQPYWQILIDTSKKVLSGLGFDRIDTPTFENIDLFTKSIGSDTDIVAKEMFRLESSRDSDEQAIYALRPEGTAGIVRAFIQNGMSSLPQPVRLYYMGKMFRHERPQKGRLREFNQIGAEIFGDASAKSDYLVIMSAWEILTRLGLKDLKVYANSIGCSICRPKYLAKLKKYYKEELGNMCEDCQTRFAQNPLRLLDCKNDFCQKITQKAPGILDMLCKTCRDHFQDTLEYLDYFDIKYDLDSKLVRGLDYYTNTVFEIASKDDNSRNNVVCGGGRYNNLVKLFNGPDTPAVGFSIGAERVVSLLIEQKIKVPAIRGVEVCILQLGEKAKEVSKHIYDQLAHNDINVYFVPSDEGLRQQIRFADKLGAKYAVIIGQKEAFKDEIILRDLEASSQEVFPTSGLVTEIKRRFERCQCK